MDIEMAIKKEETSEEILSDISMENSSETIESVSNIEMVAEVTTDATKPVSSATTNEVETASDADTSTPAAGNPSGTKTAEATQIDTDTAENSAEAAPADADTAEAAPSDVKPTETAPAEANPAETTSPTGLTAEKNVDKKGRLWGILELTAAALILAFSAYLFYNTRGTRLLFVDVAFGRICRYYWIGLLAAMIPGLVGWLTLKRHTHTTAETDTKENK